MKQKIQIIFSCLILIVTIFSGNTTANSNIGVRRQSETISNHKNEISKKGRYREARRYKNFVAYENGIIYDAWTGLEWIVGPDKKTTLDEAMKWVDNLSVAGGGWRMPTSNELEGIYWKRKGTQNIIPLFKTTGSWVWSTKRKGTSLEWPFSFQAGKVHWYGRLNPLNSRSFAVRLNPGLRLSSR